MIKVSTTGMAVSLKTDLRFPISGQWGHGDRIIQQAFVNGIREEGRQEGREEGRALTLYSLVNSGNLKPDIAAKELGISIHEFEIAMKEAGMNQPVSK